MSNMGRMLYSIGVDRAEAVIDEDLYGFKTQSWYHSKSSYGTAWAWDDERTEIASVRIEQTALADSVSHPAHYAHPSGIEVIDITKHETFLRENIIKYVLRAPYKGSELEDLQKARAYLEWEIERLSALQGQ